MKDFIKEVAAITLGVIIAQVVITVVQFTLFLAVR